MINWHDRYAKLVRREPGLFDRQKSVLEVGCGPWGIALWLQRPVVGVENQLEKAPNPLIELVAGDMVRLPFEDSTFDYVVCADVLEHLPAGERERALRELVRVAREEVLISSPCGTAAESGERAFADFLASVGLPQPGWLDEHFENGLPRLRDVIEPLLETGYSLRVEGNESRLQHYAGLLLDTALPTAAEWNLEHAAKCVLEPPIGESAWDQYYSYLFVVDKTARGASTPDAGFTSSGTGADASSALYAVVHDAALMDDVAPIRYVRSGSAADAVDPTGIEPPALVDAGYLPNWRWSELSAIYSVWKDGPTTDIVGFCHYRRLFDFRKNGVRQQRESTITRHDLPRIKEALSPDEDLAFVREGGVIVASPVDLGESIFDNYSHYHNANDYLLLLTIVGDSRRELLPFLLEQFDSRHLYSNNMFLMPWALFDRLCSAWFPILQEFCDRADAERAQEYQNRDVSFLSERLFSAWIGYIRSNGVSVHERPIFFVGLDPQSTSSAPDAFSAALLRPTPAIGEPLNAARAAAEAAHIQAKELQLELEERAAVLARLTEELQTKTREAEDTKVHLASALEALSSERAAMTEIADSASWRATAPLRSGMRLAKKAVRAVHRGQGVGGPR